MDITSYLLGKQAGSGGGGGVEEYFENVLSTANARTLIKKVPAFSLSSSLTQLTSAFSGWGHLTEVGVIGNTSQVTNFMRMFQDCIALESVPLFDTSNGLYFTQMFESCKKLVSVPQFNTGKSQSFNGMFRSCYALTDVPVFDMSSATDVTNMFNSCGALSDNSLNNIMASCISATNYTGTKQLSTIGLNSTQRQKCTTLSNYQALLDAGWTL